MALVSLLKVLVLLGWATGAALLAGEEGGAGKELGPCSASEKSEPPQALTPGSVLKAVQTFGQATGSCDGLFKVTWT